MEVFLLFLKFQRTGGGCVVVVFGWFLCVLRY